MPKRLEQLSRWLDQQTAVDGIDIWTIEPASDDASFRRYFRVSAGDASYIVMDAPPEQEDCRPFIRVAGMLATAGINVPEIFSADREQGFLLLGDLGSETYLQALDRQLSPDDLYPPAIKALVTMQSGCRNPAVELPPYDAALLMQEMELFRDWLVKVHLGLALSAQEADRLQQCFDYLRESALGQARVFVHRDYHSRNLMWGNRPPGVLDFQDAVYGPLTYDLVSLLKDCYVSFPEERILGWTDDYRDEAKKQSLALPERPEFLEQFDLMGVQRHLKASGIFARLWHRDGKASYLEDVPRTLGHIVALKSTSPEIVFLQKLINERVLPALAETTS